MSRLPSAVVVTEHTDERKEPEELALIRGLSAVWRSA